MIVQVYHQSSDIQKTGSDKWRVNIISIKLHKEPNGLAKPNIAKQLKVEK